MRTEVTIAKELFDARTKKSSLEEQTKTINQTIKDLEEELIEELVEQGKKSTGLIDGVGNFTIAKERFPSVKKEFMGGFINYIKKTDDAGIVKETIHPQTLKSHLKNKIAQKIDYYAENPDILSQEYPEKTPEEAAVANYSALGVTIFEKFTVKKTK